MRRLFFVFLGCGAIAVSWFSELSARFSRSLSSPQRKKSKRYHPDADQYGQRHVPGGAPDRCVQYRMQYFVNE